VPGSFERSLQLPCPVAHVKRTLVVSEQPNEEQHATVLNWSPEIRQPICEGDQVVCLGSYDRPIEGGSARQTSRVSGPDRAAKRIRDFEAASVTDDLIDPPHKAHRCRRCAQESLVGCAPRRLKIASSPPCVQKPPAEGAQAVTNGVPNGPPIDLAACHVGSRPRTVGFGIEQASNVV
jgi:hypothetical protein